jgi:hypothetical protein
MAKIAICGARLVSREFYLVIVLVLDRSIGRAAPAKSVVASRTFVGDHHNPRRISAAIGALPRQPYQHRPRLLASSRSRSMVKM